MTTEQIKDLNKKRVQLQLKKLFDNTTPKQAESFKRYKIFKNDKQVQLNDIDFNKSMIFICQSDFLGLLGIYGMHRVNNLKVGDTTTTARYSTVRTSYMITNSQEAKYSRLANDVDFVQGEEQYMAISYITKDIVLWRLFSDAGLGDNNIMYRICSSLIDEREYSKKTNWIFYLGNKQDLYNQYSIPEHIPVYEILKGTSSTTKTGTNVNNLCK